MKQAILITAYKNYSHLLEIVNFFDEQFTVYIHLDKKSTFTENQLLKLRSIPIVDLVTQRYNVNWGGLNHLQAILHLSEKALENPANFYFHLISGHDFPIKPKEEFISFFSNHIDTGFLEYFSVPKKGWADNGGMDRLEYYNFYDHFNAKIPEQNAWIRRIIRFQKRIGYKRKFTPAIPQLYGGSTWWSLSRQCLEYVVQFTKERPKVFNRFRHTLCSEEFYFQTVIINNPELQRRVVSNNMRHIDWIARNGNNPAVLDESDFRKLKSSNAFFARKIEYPISANLLAMIKKDLLGD